MQREEKRERQEETSGGRKKSESSGRKEGKLKGNSEIEGEKNPGQILICYNIPFYPMKQLHVDTWLPLKTARKCNTTSLMLYLIPLI